MFEGLDYICDLGFYETNKSWLKELHFGYLSFFVFLEFSDLLTSSKLYSKWDVQNEKHIDLSICVYFNWLSARAANLTSLLATWHLVSYSFCRKEREKSYVMYVTLPAAELIKVHYCITWEETWVNEVSCRYSIQWVNKHRCSQPHLPSKADTCGGRDTRVTMVIKFYRGINTFNYLTRFAPTNIN